LRRLRVPGPPAQSARPQPQLPVSIALGTGFRNGAIGTTTTSGCSLLRDYVSVSAESLVKAAER